MISTALRPEETTLHLGALILGNSLQKSWWKQVAKGGLYCERVDAANSWSILNGGNSN